MTRDQTSGDGSGLGPDPYRNVYTRGAGDCCQAPGGERRAHTAFSDEEMAERLTAAGYLLDAVEARTPVEYHDGLAEMRVSFEYGEDPQDLRGVYDTADHDRGDRESLMDSYAVKALLGDWDIHGGNIQQTADGRFYPMDFEMAGERDLDEVYDLVKKEFWLLRMTNVSSALDPDDDLLYDLEQGGLWVHHLRDRIGVQADSVDTEALEQDYREDDHLTYRPERVGDQQASLSPAEQIMTNVRAGQDRSYRGFVSGCIDRLLGTG